MKKIAILTFQNAKNYGAVLQCFALQKYLLSNFECEVSVINYTPQMFKKVFYNPLRPFEAFGIINKIKAFGKFVLRHDECKNISKRNSSFELFLKNKIPLTDKRKRITNENYDLYIVGSDQVWNMELLDNDFTFFLPCVTAPKISYAASFKTSEVDKCVLEIMKRELATYDGISVREDDLKSYLLEKIGIDSDVNIDPTLLLKKNQWTEIMANECHISEKYVLIYFVNMPERLIDLAFEYAKNNNLLVISLNRIKTQNRYLDYSFASLPEFLYLINNANVVFTTSFHGMAFSIIFERLFCFEVPGNSYNNNNRLINLAQKLNLLKQNIEFPMNDSIKRDEVNRLLEFERKKAYNYLQKHINGNKNDR